LTKTAILMKGLLRRFLDRNRAKRMVVELEAMKAATCIQKKTQGQVHTIDEWKPFRATRSQEL